MIRKCSTSRRSLWSTFNHVGLAFCVAQLENRRELLKAEAHEVADPEVRTWL